jgi:hypothetical protein
MRLGEVLRIAIPIAHAVARAHAAGIAFDSQGEHRS